MAFQRLDGRFFVFPHQSAVVGDVGRKNCSEPTIRRRRTPDRLSGRRMVIGHGICVDGIESPYYARWMAPGRFSRRTSDRLLDDNNACSLAGVIADGGDSRLVAATGSS